MPSAMHHLSVATDAPAALISFLRDVIGLTLQSELTVPEPVTTDLLSWPAGNPGAPGWLLGSGTSGLVEVVGIPKEVQTQVRPGPGLMTFATPKFDDVIAACAARGLPISDVHRFKPTSDVGVICAVVRVAGVAIELVRYEVEGAEATL